MIRRTPTLLALGLGLIFAACNPGPSGSGSSPASKDDAAALERKAGHLERLLARRADAANALEALASALPGRTWLLEVAYDSGKIKVRGRAATNNLLADYITRLGENPSFTGMTLGGSVMKNVRGRESQEFALEIALVDPAGEGVSSGPGADPAARLRELEAKLPPRQDTAGTLREIQRLALDSGLQMTKFAPGAEVSGELTTALPATVEVSGDLRSLGRYLRGLAGLPGLWVVDKLTLRAAAPDDPRSEYRASIAARAYFVR